MMKDNIRAALAAGFVDPAYARQRMREGSSGWFPLRGHIKHAFALADLVLEIAAEQPGAEPGEEVSDDAAA